MRKEKGLSSIIGAIIFILIFTIALVLIINLTINESNVSIHENQNGLNNVLGKPLLYEYFDKGVTYLVTTYPTVITYIYYPNGSFVSTHILVKERIPVLELLNGYPWTIVVTDQGVHYNVTLLKVPGVLLSVSAPSQYIGIPWVPSALDVSETPNWGALKGIRQTNLTPVTIECPVVNWLGYTTGQIDKEIEYYINETQNWLVITYYAPIQNTVAYNSYYDMYYDTSLPSSLTPSNNFDFYILLTSNPYIKQWAPLWYSAIYYQAQGRSIQNPQGGIEFSYDYIEATIGVYVPVLVNNVVQYSYIYFNDFEVTNLTALVPSAVTTTGAVNAIWRYSPFSWVDAPLIESPSTGAITTAYGNNLPSFTSNLYPSGTYQYTPEYENFPASNYGGFPAYFGNYTVPGHNFDLNNPNYVVNYEPVSEFIPSPTGSEMNTYGYISSSTLIPYYYDPMTVYALAINFQQGLILNFGYDPMTGLWILLYEGHLQPTGSFYYELPVYVTIPQSTYLLSFSTILPNETPTTL